MLYFFLKYLHHRLCSAQVLILRWYVDAAKPEDVSQSLYNYQVHVVKRLAVHVLKVVSVQFLEIRVSHRVIYVCKHLSSGEQVMFLRASCSRDWARCFSYNLELFR